MPLLCQRAYAGSSQVGDFELSTAKLYSSPDRVEQKSLQWPVKEKGSCEPCANIFISQVRPRVEVIFVCGLRDHDNIASFALCSTVLLHTTLLSFVFCFASPQTCSIYTYCRYLFRRSLLLSNQSTVTPLRSLGLPQIRAKYQPFLLSLLAR